MDGASQEFQTTLHGNPIFLSDAEFRFERPMTPGVQLLAAQGNAEGENG